MSICDWAEPMGCLLFTPSTAISGCVHLGDSWPCRTPHPILHFYLPLWTPFSSQSLATLPGHPLAAPLQKTSSLPRPGPGQGPAPLRPDLVAQGQRV